MDRNILWPSIFFNTLTFSMFRQIGSTSNDFFQVLVSRTNSDFFNVLKHTEVTKKYINLHKKTSKQEKLKMN